MISKVIHTSIVDLLSLSITDLFEVYETVNLVQEEEEKEIERIKNSKKG